MTAPVVHFTGLDNAGNYLLRARCGANLDAPHRRPRFTITRADVTCPKCLAKLAELAARKEAEG